MSYWTLPYQIPVVDLGGLLRKNSCFSFEKEDSLEVVRRLDNACSSCGMFLVTASEDEISRITEPAFAATSNLFALPSDIKLKTVPSEPVVSAARGYIGLGAESGSGLFENKECFSFGPDLNVTDSRALTPLQAENVWPAKYASEEVAPFKSYLNAMKQVTRILSRLMAFALDDATLESEAEEGTMISMMRLFHYFPGQDGSSTGSSAHTDWGMFTIVAQEPGSEPALQIFVNGCWHSVAPRANSLVVNVGDYLQLRSKGRWKSPLHRVVSTPKERTSLCYFHYPAFDTPVPSVEEPYVSLVAGATDKHISFVTDQGATSESTQPASHMKLQTMGLAIAEKWRQVSRTV